MSNETPSRETTFGYLTTLQSPEHGYFGGYLIVSELGRPLEFHCTSPVRPSRAQEILYGPTLQPYLIGEQIGGSLLEAAKLTPRLILTDQAATMVVRSRTEVPMVFVLARAELQNAPAIQIDAASDTIVASTAGDGAVLAPSSYGQFSAGNYELQLPFGFESDQAVVIESLALLTQHVDLAEPFGRIHEAIREAQRIGGRTSEVHGQAA